jgi:hypothetical protein
MHFNTVHPPTSWSSQWCLSFWLSHQYPTCIPLSFIASGKYLHNLEYRLVKWFFYILTNSSVNCFYTVIPPQKPLKRENMSKFFLLVFWPTSPTSQ